MRVTEDLVKPGEAAFHPAVPRVSRWLSLCWFLTICTSDKLLHCPAAQWPDPNCFSNVNVPGNCLGILTAHSASWVRGRLEVMHLFLLFFCLCVCTCMWVCMDICARVWICMEALGYCTYFYFFCSCTCVCVHHYMCVRVGVHGYTCTCVYVHTCICTYVHVSVGVHGYMYIRV